MADPYTTAVLADAPDVYYLFDNTSGGGGHDSSGNNRDLTHISGGSGVWGSGPYTGWYSSYADMNRDLWNLTKTSNWTYEFWVKNSSTQMGVVCNSAGGGSRGWAFEYNRNFCTQPGSAPYYLNLMIPGAWGCTTMRWVSDAAWHYVALVLGTGGAWSYYLDGTNVGTSTNSSTITPYIAGDVLNIGTLGTADPNRVYSRFACYPTALSSAQIAAHYAAAGPVTVATCAYGTRKKATSPAVDLLTEAAITGILLAAGLSWWEVLLVVFAGQQIDVNKLCSSLPPQPPPPTPDALNYPPYKLLEYLYQNVWNYYCECVPGSPAAPPPPAGTATKPTGFPDPRVIVVNPTNPCLDLTEVRRMLDAILRQLNIDVQMDTLLQRYSLPFATVRGTSHFGLVATGSLSIADLIGVQITITDRPPNRELEGAPNYVWDLGWISCMDGNGFIQERRITRDVEVWMPREFQEATILGYVFKTGVTATITELLPEA